MSQGQTTGWGIEAKQGAEPWILISEAWGDPSMGINIDGSPDAVRVLLLITRDLARATATSLRREGGGNWRYRVARVRVMVEVIG